MTAILSDRVRTPRRARSVGRPRTTLLLRVAALTILVGGGMIVYAAAVFITRAYTIRELRAVLKRKPKPAKEEQV